jgi:hypothetical protein
MSLYNVLASRGNGYGGGQTTHQQYTPGTYTFTAYSSNIGVVAIGGGGSGGQYVGGGGGALSYNNITVTPGQNYTVVVGAGGAASTGNPNSGGDSYFCNLTGYTITGTIALNPNGAGFSGSGQYLTLPSASNSYFALGTANFTLECWVYLNANPAQYQVIFAGINYGSASDWGLYAGYSGGSGTYGPAFQMGSGGWLGGNFSTIQIPLSTWTHVAVVRIGSTTTMYINGISVATSTTVYSLTSTVQKGIGGGYNGNGNTLLNGNISNLRIVNGTGVYTGAFTPPTAPLATTQSAGTNIAAITTGTQLLTCQAYPFTDTSTNAIVITNVGNIGSITGPFPSNTITMNSTSGLLQFAPIVISGTTIGNLTAGTYYIQSIFNSTNIVISQTQYGTPVTQTTATGTMTAVSTNIFAGGGGGGTGVGSNLYYINAPNSPDQTWFNFTTNTSLTTTTNFCIEFHIMFTKPLTSGTYYTIFGSDYQAGAFQYRWNMSISSSGISHGNAGYTTWGTYPYIFNPYTWYHFAIIGGGGNGDTFISVNGIVTDTGNPGGGSQAYTAGGNYSNYFAFFSQQTVASIPYILRNFRIVSGSNVYGTTSFTAPAVTSTLTAIAGTQLLIGVGPTLQDSSTNNILVKPESYNYSSNSYPMVHTSAQAGGIFLGPYGANGGLGGGFIGSSGSNFGPGGGGAGGYSGSTGISSLSGTWANGNGAWASVGYTYTGPSNGSGTSPVVGTGTQSKGTAWYGIGGGGGGGGSTYNTSATNSAGGSGGGGTGVITGIGYTGSAGLSGSGGSVTSETGGGGGSNGYSGSKATTTTGGNGGLYGGGGGGGYGGNASGAGANGVVKIVYIPESFPSTILY